MPQNVDKSNAAGPRARLDIALVLFLLTFGSYAYFWQSRDWNTATRLMLTYALGDRHQVEIDGLEQQAGERKFNWSTRRYEIVTGDVARVDLHYYTDKAPGQSLLGLPVYGIGKLAGLERHPLNRDAFAYWPADYWVTLFTSGLLTAAISVVLYAFSLRLGAAQFAGAIVGLGYGLGSPAFLYATLFYGHQAAAFCTATSFFLLYRAAHEGRANVWNMLLAGLLAGFAPVVEYQTIGISAVLGLYAVAVVRRVRPVMTFALAAAFAASLLAAYNYRAFGNPLELSYAHEVSAEFRAIHSTDNPLGLRLPRDVGEIIASLVWSRYRGLAVYAPLVVAAPLGLMVLLGRRFRGVALVATAAFAWMFAVNVTYPLWRGGWCTGPRFLLPALPFLFLAVAAVLGADRTRITTALAAPVALLSAALLLGCVSVGGRFPDAVRDPLVDIAWRRWCGEQTPGLDVLAGGRQFEWNVGRWLIERFAPMEWPRADASVWSDLEFVPLVVFWVVMTGVLAVFARRDGRAATPTNTSLAPAGADAG